MTQQQAAGGAHTPMSSTSEPTQPGPVLRAVPPVPPARVRDLPAQGVDLRALVELLLADDPADLPDVDLLGTAAGWQQLIGMAVAAQGAVVSEMVARRPRTPSHPVDDLACALSITSHGAHALVSRADGLATHPVLADGLRAGVLDQRKVDVLLDEVARLPRDDADQVLRAAVDDADGLTAPLLRRATRRLVAAVDPDAAAKRAVKARQDRCVRLDWADDSMAWVTALLPGPDAVAVFSVVDAMADAAHTADDPRTVAQRRADAFSDVFATILATGRTPSGARLPTRQGAAPGVHLTVAASTLAGSDDLPGELAGYGPIPAAMARELACHAVRYRPALIDPDGHLVALGNRTLPLPAPPTGSPTGSPPIGSRPIGTPPPPVAEAPPGARAGSGSPAGPLFADPEPVDRYRPSAELRRFVVARDQTCAFPGCRQPAAGCDLDHADPFDPTRSAIEQTLAANLQPLCRHHHLAKTHHGWRLRRDPHTGDVHTTSPYGVTYVRPATTILLTKSTYEHAIAPYRPLTARDDEPPPF